MDISPTTKIYCLIGNPIYKSLSPQIHNSSFKRNNLDAVYLAFNIEDFENSINGLKALGINGFNVTIPFKEKIIEYLDEIDYLAKNIGAVNTVLNIDGKLKGFNTDGLGFIKSLEERNIQLVNKSILILGAGGASRGISMALASKGIKSLHITNRTEARGIKLIADIKSYYKDLTVNFIHREDIKDDYDIVINTTSIGMYPDGESIPIDVSIFDKNTIIYDIIYKPRPTKLLKTAKTQGKSTIDGVDMLIYQALLSEEIWLREKMKIFQLKNEIKEGLWK